MQRPARSQAGPPALLDCCDERVAHTDAVDDALWIDGQTRPLLPPAPPVAAASLPTSVAAIDAAFNDNDTLLRRAREQARSSREKGWSTAGAKPRSQIGDTGDATAATASAAAAAASASSAAAASSTAAVATAAPRSSTTQVAHPHKLSTSAARSSRRSRTAFSSSSSSAAATSAAATVPSSVPSALEERHAARQEREEFQARYARRLEQFASRRSRRVLLRMWRGWSGLACTPRDVALRARAFAQFQLLLRTMQTWRVNGKLVRERKMQSQAQQQQAQENRLVQRALKFDRSKRLLKSPPPHTRTLSTSTT